MPDRITKTALRDIRKSDHFNILATHYASKHRKPGEDFARALDTARRSNSKFTQAYLKAYYKKGTLRTPTQVSTAPRGAVARLTDLTGITPPEEASWRHYVIKGV